MSILSFVTDNNPSWIDGREETVRRNYFMINLHEIMGPGWDRTHDPWINSKTGICLLICDKLAIILLVKDLLYSYHTITHNSRNLKARIQ